MTHAKIAMIVMECVKEMPAELQARAKECDLIILSKPDTVVGLQGLRTDMRGAYVEIEPDYGEDMTPKRLIFLFSANIVPLDEYHVVQTYLHELGHAMDLDEYELETMGLRCSSKEGRAVA